MRKLVFVVTFLLATSAFAAPFDEMFLDRTMRVNYFHTGNHGEEIIALDSVVSDGPWPGSRTRLIDTLNLGNYYFDVIDRDTNQAIYSRGFASVFGEWQTTDEANQRAGTFAESVRFPWPKHPVQLVIKKRDANGAFQQLWSTLIDPSSRFVNPSERKPAGHVWNVIENGPPSEKVDILVIGEGYTESELPKFHKDVARMVGKLFDTEPFKSRRKDFNVRALDLAEPASGVHRPRTNDNRRTMTGVQYNIFDSERYVLTLDDHRMRDVASSAPYDFIEILVNEKQYGGGGMHAWPAGATPALLRQLQSPNAQARFRSRVIHSHLRLRRVVRRHVPRPDYARELLPHRESWRGDHRPRLGRLGRSVAGQPYASDRHAEPWQLLL